MNLFKRSIVLTIGVAVIGFGTATTLAAAVGVGAWDALCQTISIITRYPVGNISIVLNCSCVLVQLIILKSKFTIMHYMQVPLSIFLGAVINFIYYGFYNGINFDSYIISIVLFLVGTIIVALGVAIVMSVNLVSMALEGACMEVGILINKKMHVLRQAVDIICVVLVIIVAFVLDINLVVREGTIISAVIFGPLIGIYMNILTPVFAKLNLT